MDTDLIGRLETSISSHSLAQTFSASLRQTAGSKPDCNFFLDSEARFHSHAPADHRCMSTQELSTEQN